MASYSDYLTTPDGAVLRYGVWRAGGAGRKGTMVVLSGRNEFLEKYEETIGELEVRGWDVYSFDWRGQGLSSRMLPDRHTGHIEDYAVYIDDLDRFLRRVVLPHALGPVTCLAHSMGAHILLRYLARGGGVFGRVVMTSPMFGISTGFFPMALAKWLIRTAMRLGRATAYAPGERRYRPPGRYAFRYNRLTSDRERFMRPHRMIARNPDLALGGVSCGWLQASFDSIEAMMSPAFAATVATPVLLVSSGDDQVVSTAAQTAVCRRLPDCRLVSIPGARHELLMERDHFRAAFWRAFDAFMAETPPEVGRAFPPHSASKDSRNSHRS